MACSGSYCANHCYNNACGGKYRAPRTGNPYTFPDIGGEPTANFTNHLKTALNQEINERNSKLGAGISSVTFTNTVADSSIIAKTNTEVMVELKNKINSIHNGWVNDSYTQGTPIKSYHWTNIRDKILQLMRECLCNGDCGAHAVCPCHGDCGCNYSDRLLKENIEEDVVYSLEGFNSIKSKCWNYIDEPNRKHYGPMAQDVLEYYPHAVRKDKNGYLMLEESSMIGILWSALNKSIDRIEELETRLNKLEQHINV